MAIKRTKKLIRVLCVLLALAGLFLWLRRENTALEYHVYTVTGNNLPSGFDGYRIAQVSDLHNAQMGTDNKDLLDMLRQAQPDMIAITGDLIDIYHTDAEVALSFAEEAAKIAPCYFVKGNHEARYAEYAAFKSALEEAGVTVLADSRVTLEKNGDSIFLIGLDDNYWDPNTVQTVLDSKLTHLVLDEDPYTILLSHRPETPDIFARHNVDLVLSGHLHGGQFRLPYVGGIYTPSTGFFPEYDGGLYTQGETNLIVSRGIGNSIFPVRINNRPELVMIRLQTP